MRASGLLVTLSAPLFIGLSGACAQTAPQNTTDTSAAASVQAPTQPTPPPPNNAFSSSSIRFLGIDVSGSLDGYYSWNDNHPGSGLNALYNFDDHTDEPDLNLAKLTLTRDPAPLGFRVDVGFGRAMQIAHTPVPDPSEFRFIEQAYVSVKPKDWKGFELDLGDFVTSAGAEVIETKDNWNYSRSLLFALAIPYYHFGIRSSMPIGSSLNLGLQLVNGWNEIVDQHGNNMQTVGVTGAITRKKFTWSNNYYVGPQYTASTRGDRNLYDTTLLLTPTDKFNAYINFDYGQQHAVSTGLNHWQGVALAAHYQVTKRVAFSPRFEYYDDATSFTTGVKQKLHEVTVTGEYKIVDGILTRLEFRRDGSDIPYFDRGAQIGVARAQTTATIGLIAYFPVKH
jgi:hypothetical protein